MSLTSQPVGSQIDTIQINVPNSVSVRLVAVSTSGHVIVQAPENLPVSMQEHRTTLRVRIGQSDGPALNTGSGAVAIGTDAIAAGAGGIAVRGDFFGDLVVEGRRVTPRTDAPSGEAIITFPSSIQVFFTHENTNYTTEGNVKIT